MRESAGARGYASLETPSLCLPLLSTRIGGGLAVLNVHSAIEFDFLGRES